jgi:SHS2 domain-containing protein
MSVVARSIPAAELFPHDADIGVRGHGATVEQAFEQAATALMYAITDQAIVSTTRVQVSCNASDLESLLVEWLNAIIYETAVRQLLFGRFAVKIDGTRLQGELWGEPVDAKRHAPACEPKGATYTALRVEQNADRSWSAGCVVDV